MTSIHNRYEDFNAEEFKLHKYSSLQEYREAQVEQTNRKYKKFDRGTWDTEIGMVNLAKYIAGEYRIGVSPGKYMYGLCHGTRHGIEQQIFKIGFLLAGYHGVAMLGTEIADIAAGEADTIIWDFHDIKDDWINNIDMIYSNSLDHSYDPVYCLSQWGKCIRDTGVIILAYSERSHASFEFNTVGDPFSGSLETYEKIIDLANLDLDYVSEPGEFCEADEADLDDTEHSNTIRHLIITK
jgi:hypothetical protein